MCAPNAPNQLARTAHGPAECNYSSWSVSGDMIKASERPPRWCASICSPITPASSVSNTILTERELEDLKNQRGPTHHLGRRKQQTWGYSAGTSYRITAITHSILWPGADYEKIISCYTIQEPCFNSRLDIKWNFWSNWPALVQASGPTIRCINRSTNFVGWTKYQKRDAKLFFLNFRIVI